MKKLATWEAIGILVGTVVGAGFLGIPYVVARVGMPIGLLLVLLIAGLMFIQFLLVAEIALRTQGKHQIAGYIERYLGPQWRHFVYILVIMEAYGGLLAFIVGQGQVLSALFGISEWIGSYIFFTVAGIALFFGLRLIEKLDLLLTVAMAAVVIAICFFSWSYVRYANFSVVHPQNILPAYGVILFSFLGASAVPEARQVLSGKESKFPKVIGCAILIPAIIYILFTAAVLGITGEATTQVATIGLGERLGPGMAAVGNILAFITMTTAFLGLSLAVKDTYEYDLKESRLDAWLLAILPPLILFSFGLHNFIRILLFVGAFFGGLQGIILAFAALRAERMGDRKPEFTIPHKKIFATILTFVFAAGIAYSLVSWMV